MTNGAPYPRLLGDIGGTHVRFGWVQDAASAIAALDALSCDGQAGLDTAIARYLSVHDLGSPRSCAICFVRREPHAHGGLCTGRNARNTSTFAATGTDLQDEVRGAGYGDRNLVTRFL